MSALLPPPVILERVGRVAPLGLRFWDGALGSFVGGGLEVRALEPDRPTRWTTATASSAGVYGFVRLPGLPAVESFGEGDDAYWAQVSRRRWVIEVRDPAGQFLPCKFDADAPARGLLADLCAGSPLWLPAGSAPLFSSPARPVPAGMAAVRAEIVDGAGRPAAQALLAVEAPQASAMALADARGRALAILPWPAPERSLGGAGGGSPLLGANVPLWEQTWPLTVRVAWDGAGDGAGAPLPDLCAALAQPDAPLLTTSATLRYGVETVLRLVVV